MCSSTSTTTVDYKDKTDEELRYDAKVDALIDTAIKEMGYTVQEKKVPKYKDPARIDKLNADIAAIDQQLANLPDYQDSGPLQTRRNNLTNQLEAAMANVEYEYEYTYEMDPEKKAAMEENQVLAQTAQKNFYENYNKIASGDFTVSPEQQAFIQEQVKMITEPVNLLLDEATKIAEQTGQDRYQVIEEYMDQIRQTGLDVAVGLNAVADQVKNTYDGVRSGLSAETQTILDNGLNVKAALSAVRDEINKTGGETAAYLQDSFNLKRTLMKNGLEQEYERQRNETATRAALLGRSPMDPQFQYRMQAALQQKIVDANLQLDIAELEMMSQLKERTGLRREELALKEAGFEQELSAKLEGVKAKETGVAEAEGQALTKVQEARVQNVADTGANIAGAISEKGAVAKDVGAAKLAIQESKAGVQESAGQYGAKLVNQYGVGIPSNVVGLGVNVADYTKALNSQGAANALMGATAVEGQADDLLTERMGEKTETTTSTPSVLGSILSVGGVAAGGVGSILDGLKS